MHRVTTDLMRESKLAMRTLLRRPGFAVAQAQAEVDRITASFEETFPNAYGGGFVLVIAVALLVEVSATEPWVLVAVCLGLLGVGLAPVPSR